MLARDEVLDYLRRQLVGPADGDRELIEVPPDRRYLMGTLYPQDEDRQELSLFSAEEPDGTGPEMPNEENVADGADPLPGANAWLPSSLGISLFTDATQLQVVCRAARYVTHPGSRRTWQREPLPDEEITVSLDTRERPVFGGRGLVRVRWRVFAGRRLVTVALVNAAEAIKQIPGVRTPPKWDDMLFQVSLEAGPVDGEILPYPSVQLTSRDEEEQELRLQYLHAVTHAVGHSCAVDELADAKGRTVGLRSQVLPVADVPKVKPAGPLKAPTLRLARLYNLDLPDHVLKAELREFVAGYRAWYEAQIKIKLPPWGADAADRILWRLRVAVERMEAGVEELFTDPTGDALRAFKAANHAMHLQMRHSEADLAGRRRPRAKAAPVDPKPKETASWHPFQLAFFLLSVRGLIDEKHSDRTVVDLIWFPTGGGKTEAYLFLACFEMVLRRLRYGTSGEGTAVLSRYTLSLLTTQQFQRAATTVCALEWLRQENHGAIPGGPFTIGLWVGQSTTENRYDKANAAFRQLRGESHPKDVFILDRCPWCGTRIMPEAKSPDISDYGVRTSDSSFQFFCPRDDCRFHDELPVAVVDDHIYDNPPTFLLGTVDKFARLAWEPSAGRLFGADGRRPPSLVIQDELHLLTGPLGTTAGLYESAVVELCKTEDSGPKIIASTATIRRAGEQVRQIYGRDVQLFPSAGLDARYSYFAEPDLSVPGRSYAGLMAQGHTAGRATAVAAAALLQAPMELSEEHRDDYWTLIAYHHSMRELGRTHTAAGDDIPAQLAAFGSDGKHRDLPGNQVEELSSNMERAEQPKLLDRLELPYTDRGSLSLVVSTNMLSVGVDRKRLALMLMLGQPKANTEYIQATSRVGRHDVPGLIVTFYNATRSRDRSYYEGFGPFHRALYRNVEPTSVTPWSIPSRRRALHAVLVILVRHGMGLALDNQAGLILDYPTEFADAAAKIADWAARCDRKSAAAVEADLDELLRDWRERAREAREKGLSLYYKPAGKKHLSLLKDFGRVGGVWVTHHSMRSVDPDCQMIVKGAG
ncbi:helicase-related protein [Streptosporangium sp. NPDC002524]|uniref:helicase-related protein n=1 Tax=Streptosporangium sp. NPDC002524 TaxID=3154537 RepID=UPI003324153A